MGQGRTPDPGRGEGETGWGGQAGKECLIGGSRMGRVLPIGCMRAWGLMHARMHHMGRAASAGGCFMHAGMHGSRMLACTASYTTAQHSDYTAMQHGERYTPACLRPHALLSSIRSDTTNPAIGSFTRVGSKPTGFFEG